MDTDQLYKVAEEIFFELAPENLNEDKIQYLQANASHFFIEVKDRFSDWEGMLYEAIEADEYIELWFVIETEPDLSGMSPEPTIIAKMLLSIDEHDKDCHIDWSPISR